MRAYPFLIALLTLVLLAVTVFGSGDSSSECLTCHSGPAPKGSYRMELPRVVLQAPQVVNGSSSFQLLVLLDHKGGYEIVAPRCTVACSEGGGAPVEEGAEMRPTGAGYSAVVRVNATNGPVVVTAKVEMLLHFDHPDPDNTDLAAYTATSSVRVDVNSSDLGPDGEAPEPERSPGASLFILASVAVLAACVLPRRRTGRI